MTLLEMIKKYEKLKGEMKKKHAEDDEFIVDCILKDLRSVVTETSEASIRKKLLKKIDIALGKKDLADANQLIYMLSTMHL